MKKFNKVSNTWFKFLKYTIEFVFFIILIYYLCNCSLYQYKNSEFKVSGLLLLSLILFYYLFYKIFKKIESKSPIAYKISLFIVSLLLYTFWGVYAKTSQISDYEVLINGAKQMLEGAFNNLSFDKTNYFYFYNFQTGFVTYLFLLMKIFGKSLFSLKIIEILVMSLTNTLIYDIASKVYSRKVGIISSIIYTLLLFNISGSSVINNQHISTFFVVLSLYFFIKNKWYFNILSGILLAISYILRPSSIIIILGICIFIIWKLLINNFKNWKSLIVSLLLFIFSILIIIKIFDYIMIHTNTVPNSAVNGNVTTFKFVLGIQSCGIYGIPTENAERTQVYFDLEHLNFDYDLYNYNCKKYVLDKYINDTKNTIKSISNKMIPFCGGPDNQIYFAWQNVKDDNLCTIIYYYGYAQYILLIVLNICSSVFFISKMKRTDKNQDIKQIYNLFKIIFILYFISHIFIEVQPRYRYDQYLMLSLISSPFLSILFTYLDNFFKNKKLTII